MIDASSLPYAVTAANIAAVTWQSPVDIVGALSAKTGPKETAVPAHANHGRWIVECPDCHGAQLAHPTDHRFMCNVCANVAVDGLFRPVAWPKKRTEVEALLHVRPIENQNWTPGEKAADLRAMNKAMGV